MHTFLQSACLATPFITCSQAVEQLKAANARAASDAKRHEDEQRRAKVELTSLQVRLHGAFQGQWHGKEHAQRAVGLRRLRWATGLE